RESTFQSRRCRYGDRRINLTSFPWLPSVSPHHAPTILRGGAEQKVTKVTKESGRTPAETLLFNVEEFCRRSALACRSRKCWLLRGGMPQSRRPKHSLWRSIMTKQIIIGGVVAGLAMFIWGAVSHMALGLQESGIKQFSNEA